MRRFWMVMRYREDALRNHPEIDQRNIFYMGQIGKREDINEVLFPTEAQANTYARDMARANPTDSVVVLEQKSIFELPELPAPVKKRFTAQGELIPDA